ncbi:LacI family transcriptional regulator [Capsulimonas corticalis]|uniref:LacI family transcriptional regulator n=1 Tax=Capsulimonas corticalis TaxID=2219043 RepID=A0A402CS83_9BACT|nr:LacI family DNA-binding transcriptional regulator [Capsulimonas corticalis]BDI28294.1 LacI family transcriptional regulator [Capsulimonas corticalis]
MAVTLKDIAERTGVSPSVVSTVLSGRDNGTFVSENTRRKVLQVAEMLNYTPVRSGRPRGSQRLRRQRTEQFIGIWDPEYSSASAHAIQFLQAALRKHAEASGAESEDDFGLRLLTSDDLPKLDAIGIMGLILLSSTLLPREAASATIPCVMIGEVDNPPRELFMAHTNEFAAGRELGDYLWSLGHRRVAMIAPSSSVRVSRQRLQGMQAVWIKRQGNPADLLSVPFDVTPVLTLRDQVRKAIFGLAGPEVPPSKKPTAIVCYDEKVAAVAAQTLSEIDVRVPAQMSLASFQDTPDVGEFFIPPLTAIRAPIAELAVAAMEQLYLMHDQETTVAGDNAEAALSAQLIIRNSCAPPPQA